VHLREIGGELLAQKDAFLCAAKGVSLGIAFTKRFGAGLFGGEGFILERLQGDGLAFLHAGGTIYQRDLGMGESMRVDTGCIVAFQPTVDYNIEFVGKIKSALFGGEGLFFATLRGLPDLRVAFGVACRRDRRSDERDRGCTVGLRHCTYGYAGLTVASVGRDPGSQNASGLTRN
jgi:hypothetical protein